MADCPRDLSPPPVPGEVIRRLPPGVDYTKVKEIIWSLPSPLTVLAWVTDDPRFAPFRGWTYRAVDRELRRREDTLNALAPDKAAQERALLTGLREQLVLQLVGETATDNQKWIESRLVDPTRFLAEHRPPGLNRLTLVIRVYKATKRGPKVLDDRLVVSEPRHDLAPDTTVNWLSPERVNHAYMELLWKDFRRIFSRRSGHGWRTNRPPVGWPLIAQHAVPALYNYFKPFYPPARPYHRFRGKILTAGRYQMQLLRDITDILRCELPYASELTVQRVKASVQRHTRQHRRERQPLQQEAPT